MTKVQTLKRYLWIIGCYSSYSKGTQPLGEPLQEAEEMVVKVISEVTSASVPNPRLAEKSYREALASSEETLGVANATRFKVQPTQVLRTFPSFDYVITGLQTGPSLFLLSPLSMQ